MEPDQINIDNVYRYINQAYKFKDNLDEALLKKDIEKACELLWGIFSCYMNSIKLLMTGKPASKHGEIRDVGYGLAKTFADEKIKKAVKLAERCHASFYHSFLDFEDLKECYDAIMYAVRKADEFIKKEFKLLHKIN